MHDPTACGPASGNPYCDKSNDDPLQCIPVTDYTPNFPDDPFSVEVGDWSNKYGKMEYVSYGAGSGSFNLSDASFYEVATYDVEGLSVVFHCNDGSRAFCAPFQLVSESAVVYEAPPNQRSSESVVAKFDVLSDDSIITLSPDNSGTISVVLDTSSLNPASVGCANFEYGIFERLGSSSVFINSSFHSFHSFNDSIH